jgi:signal transduction histidine kinase
LRVEELVQLAHLDRFTALDAPRERVDLGRLLDASVETFKPRVEERGLEVDLHVEPGLPPLEANVEQLERVFLNLLDNAVKFTRGVGNVLVTAESCSHEDLEGVLVKVQDNGVGIPQSEIVRIFDRFHQVDPSSRRRFGGMGLGLSLVRSIVEAHSGVVWAESEPEVGSIFSVWLPTISADPVVSGDPGPSARVGHEHDLHRAEEEA